MNFFGKSDVGKRREVNQDSFRTLRIWNDEAILLVVCDGMGGHLAGEVASGTAVDIFCNKVLSSPCTEETPEKILEFIRYTLVCAASEANNSIFHMAKGQDAYEHMGTTLVAVIVYKDYIYAINVGDSRFYIITETETKLVTKDHSFVQYLVDKGTISPEEAKNYPRKNVITRAVGIDEKLDVDFFSAHLTPWKKGYLLLCSDGLSNYANDQVFSDILFTKRETTLEKKVDKLIAFANAEGGSDNITAVLCDFSLE